MAKAWRVELVGLDGEVQASIVAFANQARAIKTALSQRQGSSSVTTFPISDEQYRGLSLVEGQVLKLGRIS